MIYQGVEIVRNDNQAVVYRAGKFTYTVEDNSVLVTRDDSDSILTIAYHEYKDRELAQECGWQMALRQGREEIVRIKERERHVQTELQRRRAK